MWRSYKFQKPSKQIFSTSPERGGPGLGSESESVVGAIDIPHEVWWWEALAGLFGCSGLEFLMSWCLSYRKEIVISEVFYINSANSNAVWTNRQGTPNQKWNAVTHKNPTSSLTNAHYYRTEWSNLGFNAEWKQYNYIPPAGQEWGEVSSSCRESLEGQLVRGAMANATQPSSLLYFLWWLL